MRETCARVLAAALMAGTIATVVGMAALVQAPHEASKRIAAPPSVLQRSVRLTAHAAPRPRRRVQRLVATRTIPVPAHSDPVRPSLVAIRRRPARLPVRRRELSATTPAPAPAPVSEPAAAPVEPAAPAPAVPSPEADQPQAQDQGRGQGHDPGHGRGRGHAYGNDEQDD